MAVLKGLEGFWELNISGSLRLSWFVFVLIKMGWHSKKLNGLYLKYILVSNNHSDCIIRLRFFISEVHARTLWDLENIVILRFRTWVLPNVTNCGVSSHSQSFSLRYHSKILPITKRVINFMKSDILALFGVKVNICHKKNTIPVADLFQLTLSNHPAIPEYSIRRSNFQRFQPVFNILVAIPRLLMIWGDVFLANKPCFSQ